MSLLSLGLTATEQCPHIREREALVTLLKGSVVPSPLPM